MIRSRRETVDFLSTIAPEQNAANKLWRAAGTSWISESLRGEYCKILGIALDTLPATSLISFDDYCNALAVDQRKSKPEDLAQQQDRTTHFTWKSTDFPEMAGWLTRVSPTLDQIVADSQSYQPFWAPTIRDPQHSMIWESARPHLSVIDEISHALIARMLHVDAHRSFEQTKHDLRSVRVMADWANQGWSSADWRQQIRSRELALRVAAHRLHADRPSVDELSRCFTPSGSANPLQTAADHVQYSERMMGLDAVAYVADHGFAGARHLMKWTAPNQEQAGKKSTRDERLLDFRVAKSWHGHQRSIWRSVGGRLDPDYDTLVETLQIEPMPDRLAELESLDRRWAQQVDTLKTWSASPIGAGIPFGTLPKDPEMMATFLFSFIMPEPRGLMDVEAKSRILSDFESIVIALAKYRALYGDYPDGLERLTIDEMASVPLEPFDGQGYAFERHSEGYLLYSRWPIKAPKTIDESKADTPVSEAMLKSQAVVYLEIPLRPFVIAP